MHSHPMSMKKTMFLDSENGKRTVVGPNVMKNLGLIIKASQDVNRKRDTYRKRSNKQFVKNVSKIM